MPDKDHPDPAPSSLPVEDGAVPSVGSRDQVACELANLEYERSGRPCETEDFYANADRVLSVLHEAGTQEDCEHCATRRKDDESLRRRVRERLARIDQDDIEGGYSVVEMATDLERLARVQLSGLCVREGCRAGDLPAEAEAQEDSLSELVSDTGLIREVARANVELIDLSEKINAAVERWTAEAKRRKEDLTTAPAEAGTQEDEDDGYEVMCEPVAAMVEEVRAALVPVQQDEPEDER